MFMVGCEARPLNGEPKPLNGEPKAWQKISIKYLSINECHRTLIGVQNPRVVLILFQ